MPSIIKHKIFCHNVIRFKEFKTFQLATTFHFLFIFLESKFKMLQVI
jgi:hypothetical protein